MVVAAFPFENLLIPCVTPYRTDRKLACNWEQVPNTDAVVACVSIVNFAMTTARYGVAFNFMKTIFNLAVCVPAVVSVATNVEVGKPFCSTIAEAIRSAETAAYTDLPEVSIFNFEFVVNANI